MSDLAAFVTVALAGSIYLTSPTVLTLSPHLYAFLMTIGYLLTGKAVTSFRFGGKHRGHSLFHTLALLAYGSAFVILYKIPRADGVLTQIMTTIQGTYATQAFFSFIIVNFAPRSVVSEFVKVHRLGGIAVWLMTTAQLIFIHISVDGNIGKLSGESGISLIRLLPHVLLCLLAFNGISTMNSLFGNRSEKDASKKSR